MTNQLVARSRDGQQWIELPEATLNSCPSFRRMHFCDFTTYTAKPESCAGALMEADPEKAKEYCNIEILRRPIIQRPSSNSSNVEIYSKDPETFYVTCPAQGQDVKQYRVTGHRSVPVGPGCYVKNERSTTYVTTDVPTSYLTIEHDAWTPETLLGDDTSDIISFLDSDVKTKRIRLKDIRQQMRTSRHVLHTWLGLGGSVLAISALITLTICQLVRCLQLRGLPEHALFPRTHKNLPAGDLDLENELQESAMSGRRHIVSDPLLQDKDRQPHTV